MENICRTCLRSPETLLPLFDDTQLSEKIETVSSVKITKTSNLPTKICAECIININLAYNFRRVVINSDRELKLRASTMLAQDEISNNNIINDVITFVQIKVKPESQELTEEHVFEDDVEGYTVTEDIAEEIVKVETVIEKPNQERKGNDIKVFMAVETNELENDLHKNKNVSSKATDNSVDNSDKRNNSPSKSVCNICGKAVRSDNLKKHISIHTEPPVQCKECGKTCKNTESLRAHILIHKGLEVTCEFCGQIFKFRGGYRRHVRKKHTVGASRKAKCHLCEKRFHDNTDLKKHLRSHTGERPYPCEYCKKGFSSSYALKTHVRQHTNEKPYTCDFCPMAFPQKVSLRTHLKSKHSVLLENTS